jgi:hypothetical protein
MGKLALVRGTPPIYDEICKVFPVRGKPVLFAWEDRVFAPFGGDFPPHLHAHEHVHCQRQAVFPGGVEAWWRRYLVDADFRLDEEKLGHTAEFMKRCEMLGGTRSARRAALAIVAGRLSHPMYRYRFSKTAAREYLENGYC